MEDTISADVLQDYEEVKEKFFQHSNGSTMFDILFILSFIPVLITFLPVLSRLCLLDKLIPTSSQGLLPTTAVFLTEFLTGVLPAILVLTVLSDIVALCATVLCLVSVVLLRIWYVKNFQDGWVGYWNPAVSEYYPAKKQPFLTYFRAGTFMLTAVSILAVDFHIYPRRFAKTELYGVSFMDTGTGFFIVSSALVQSGGGFTEKLLESAVFLYLGVLRYLGTWMLDYQTFDTEYGRHWNFFITLGLLKPVALGIQTLSRNRNLMSGLVLSVLNQILISTYLESYVLSNRGRENWLEANREGLVSLTGFVCIHLFARSMADLVKSVWRSKQCLQALCVLWSLSLTICLSSFMCDRHFVRVSRRLANLPYVLWMVGLTSAVLSSCISTQLLLTHLLPAFQSKSRSIISGKITPEILDSINSHGLWFFLISNLLTGLLNIVFDLYSMGAPSSMVLLVLYMVAICAAVYRPYVYKLKTVSNFFLVLY